MVKLQGPMFSLAASGTLAKTLTYSHWKGRAFARRRIIPGNPQSGGQVSLRSMFAFLGAEWGGLATAAQDTWIAPAAATIISPFNAFCASGLDRNRSFLAPSQVYPVAPAAPVDNIGLFIAAGQVRAISMLISVPFVAQSPWGYLLYISASTGFTPAFSNLVKVIPHIPPVGGFFVLTDVAPGTWYLDVKTFAPNGYIGSLAGEQSAVVT